MERKMDMRSGLEQGPMAGSCEHGGIFFDYLCDC